MARFIDEHTANRAANMIAVAATFLDPDPGHADVACEFVNQLIGLLEAAERDADINGAVSAIDVARAAIEHRRATKKSATWAAMTDRDAAECARRMAAAWSAPEL